MSYRQKTIINLSWTAALRIIVRGVAIIRVAILARLLEPSQFGIFGIAVMVLALLELMTETGINVFFLQNHDKFEKYLNTAWVVSIIRGTIISLFVILMTNPVIAFFAVPQARNLLYLIALLPLIRGFVNPSIIIFQKDLEFQREFVFKGIITVIETVGMVGFTWWLANPIGLILGMLMAALTEITLSYWWVKPWPRLKLNLIQFRDIISSGKWVTGFVILDYLFTQSDNIVVGKMLGTASLGIYKLSYTWSSITVTEISDIVYKVAFPTLSKMIAEKRNIDKVIRAIVVSICCLATLAGLAIWGLAKYVPLLLGPKWISAVPVIQVLAFLGIFRSISFSFNSIFMATGRQKYVTFILLTSVIGLLSTIIPLVSRFGLVGAGYSAVFGAAISIPVAVYLFKQTLNGLR